MQTKAKINCFPFKLFLDFLHRNCDNTNVKHVDYIHHLLGIYWLFTLFTGYEQVSYIVNYVSLVWYGCRT